MEDEIRALADTFAGLSHPVRLRMLYLMLRHRELCVCDFVEALGITQSMASRHLRYLFHLGLLRDRRDTVWVHYRISDRLDPRRRAVLRSLRSWLVAPELTRLEERLRGWQARKPCPCTSKKETAK
ncbi:MAG: helix-turn-helix transcriptional regulator [Myxococcales bacterium]|nr:helix-turn-helix transcriptional regulator [Myxococcales bacterium]